MGEFLVSLLTVFPGWLQLMAHSTKPLVTFIPRFTSLLPMLWHISLHSYLSLWIRRCIMKKLWWIGWRRLALNVILLLRCLFYSSFIGLASVLGIVALCNFSDYLYPTFWIHLCHDGSRVRYITTPILSNPSDHICRYPSISLRKSCQERFFLASLLQIWYSKLIQCKLYLLVHRSYRTLCESPTSRNVYMYVKYTFAINK